MFTDEQKKELAKPLDPKHVRPPPQGKYGEYVEGHHVISEANRIFGFDGWSYTLDELRLTNASQDGDKHRIGYLARVTVTIDGTVRGDVGHGQGFGKSEGDAHDSAIKEACTDGLKRALRCFGNTFGLALYDKTKADVCAPPKELPTGPINDTTRDWLAAQIEASGVTVQAVCNEYKVGSLKDITYEDVPEVKVWLEQQKAKTKENA